MTSEGPLPGSIRTTLAPLLGRDKDWSTRAIDGLAQLDGERLDALAAGLDDPDPVTRWWCLRLLVTTEAGSRRLDWLRRSMTDRDADVRLLAAMALHDEQDVEALPLLVEALGDENELVRDRAADTIGSLAQGTTSTFEATVDPLIRLLRDPSVMVRQTAAYALEHVGDPRAADGLAELLEDPNTYARARAALALAAIRDSRARLALVAAVRDRGMVSDECVVALGELRDTASTDFLLELFADQSDDIRHAAATALGRLRDRRAVPALLRILEERGPGWDSTIIPLGEIGDPAAVAPLLPLLSDGDAKRRWCAATALGDIGAAEAGPPLAALIRDSDREVRLAVVRALPRAAGEDAAPSLVVALGDTCPRVRLEAAEQLGRMSLGLSRVASDVHDALVRAFHDPDLEVRRAAVLAVRQRAHACPVLELVEAVKDPSRGLCCLAAITLSDLGSGTDESRGMVALLEDPRAHIRWHAATVLGEMGNASSLPVLIAAAERDADPGVRDAAALAAERIRAPRNAEDSTT